MTSELSFLAILLQKFVHYPNDEEEENDALERKGHPPLFRHDE